MDSEHGAPSRDAIYDTITNPRVTDQNTGHAIARYNREITSDLVEHIAHPVDAKINTFRDEEQSKDNEESKHPARTQMIIYLTSRLNDIESLIQYGLKQRDKDIYDLTAILPARSPSQSLSPVCPEGIYTCSAPAAPRSSYPP